MCKTYNNIIAGCTQLSKNPNRNLTAMRAAKSVDAVEQATITPQMKTLTDSIFARGSFCRRKFIGYSPHRIPMYRMVPSHWYCFVGQRRHEKTSSNSQLTSCPTRCASVLIPMIDAKPNVPLSSDWQK